MLAENYMRTHTHSRIKGNDAISNDPREKNEPIDNTGFSWVETVLQDRIMFFFKPSYRDQFFWSPGTV